jgi:hypothetical protein
MKTFGNAIGPMGALTVGMRNKVLRVSARPRCTCCGEYQRAELSTDARISVTETQLRQADGDPFAALLSKCNNVEEQQHVSECNACKKIAKLEMVPHTNAVLKAPPSLIMLELPDTPSGRVRYTLRAEEQRDLIISGQSFGSYQLVGIILYKKGAHYIADVLDQTARVFVRYDGMHNGGRGVAAGAPGPTGKVQHNGPSAGTYFPVLCAYTRVTVQE